MILNDANTPNKYIDQSSPFYWTMTIDWAPAYSFLPSVIHDVRSGNCPAYPDDIISWIMGLDSSQKDEFGFTDEQLLSTWKAFSATVHYPNDPKAFGINGDTYRYQWK